MRLSLPHIVRVRYPRFLVVFVFLCPLLLKAQLKADFSGDKAGGCSPVQISFTNKTTGASANASWRWDFGNGNTSVLQNPGAVFIEEKTYSVTLTVKDGNQTSQQTRIITVYKKPIVDFTVLAPDVCLPYAANFTSNSSPGDGSISTYLWDFGDGTAQEGTGTSISRFYTEVQTATVTLTTLNSYGCSNTVVKNDIVTIHPALNASFVEDKTILCDAPGLVNFANSSTGPGTHSYSWDFGDNTISTAASPAHTYTQKGVYTVKLTVNNSIGCSATITKNNLVNVGNFNSAFTTPAPICTNGSVSFTNNSSPLPASSVWEFDGINTYTTYYNSSVNYAFAIEGTHTVKLTNNFGPCQQTITKQIEVNKRPVLNGFIADITGLCGSPVTVNFRDTTADAVQWKWNLDNYYYPGIPFSVQAPSYVYTQDREYYVSLEVKNAAGCVSSFSEPVQINRPIVGIFLQPNSVTEACESLTVKFDPRSTEPITQYKWDFGDNTSSTEEEPSHTWTSPGAYTVSLSYTTINGCKGVAIYNSIYVRKKPVADFAVQPLVCGNTPVFFNPGATTGYVTNLTWNFGDNTGNIPYSNSMHQYQQEGTYDVTLIAYNGMCNDTIVKPAIIKVSPPFPHISGLANTCTGTRGEVTFTEASRQANSWNWDFGDGTSLAYTTAAASIIHTYARTGSYKAVLSTTNGSCTVRDSVTVRVWLKQKPLLTLSRPEICVEGGIENVQIANLERPDFNQFYPYSYRFIYGDGTPFNGYASWTSDQNQIPLNLTLSNFSVGKDGLRVIATNAFGCSDTSEIASMKIKGPVPDFDILTDNVCFKSPVTVKELSSPRNNIPVVKWEWSWGDGNTSVLSQSGNASHIYPNPGNYYMSLKVTDADGCSSIAGNKMVSVTGPKAAFSPSGTNVPLSTTVNFYNNTNNYNSPATAYAWDLGNGIVSAAQSPSYTYNTAGIYTITLIARNPDNGCADTTRRIVEVKDFNTGFITNASFIGDHNKCPPVLARFTNTSYGYTRLVWDFGDGVTMENKSNPTHIYKDPGTYIVTLYVYGYNGLTGTYKDTVFAKQPMASIQADDLDGCIGHQLTLHAPVHEPATNFLWDFGNGHLVNAADSFAIHQYMAAGEYTASLLAMDKSGCLSAAVLPDKIVIHPNPDIVVSPTAAVTCKDNGIQLQASGANSYSWSPATGLNNPAIASPIALPANTTSYSIQATDENGCNGTAGITVTVPESFDITVKAVDDICKGNSISLNAEGAKSWQWINTTEGLSGTAINDPSASPQQNTIYTVVGYDQYNCYSDTATVQVLVRPLPVVNAGPDLEVAYGSENTLMATGSSDIVRWNWTPGRSLNCTNCPSPVIRPYESLEYVVTAYNQYNCIASDSMRVKAFCEDSYIYIPTAFTPNNDGKNDVFAINGYGISKINSLRIYNRWGEIIFEKKNFYPNDISSAWNGKFKGMDAPSGAYVYFAEMECDQKQRFERKGTITLIR